MSTQKHIYFIWIHLAVFLFGAAGLFGKLVLWPPVLIVAGRVFFASVALGVYLYRFRPMSPPLTGKDLRLFLGLGFLLALHWITFFESIRISSVAVGLLTFSTFPVFTAFLEPLFMRKKIRLRDIGLAAAVFSGVALVSPKVRWGDPVFMGSAWGIISGFTFSLLSILNRKLALRRSGVEIAFYQDLAAAVILAPSWFIISFKPSLTSMALVILLGVVFTALAHTLFIMGLKGVSALKAGVIACLEPLYGIILAFFLLRETPSLRTLIGGVIILSAVFFASLPSSLFAGECD